MDTITNSETSRESCFPPSSIKIENEGEAIDSNITYSWDDDPNCNNTSTLTSTANTTNHVITTYSGSEMCRSDILQKNYVAHVNMEVFVDHTYNAFQEANDGFNVSTGPCKNSISSNYLSSASAASPKVEGHVKTEQEENCEVCINVNMIKSELDITCEQTVHSASESIYLENSSTCFNQHTGSEVQSTSANLLSYSANKMFSSCGNCEKPIKMEPIEIPEDFTDNNVENLCNTAQNTYAVHSNDQNGVDYPGTQITMSTKMEVDSEMVCNKEQELCSNVQVSDLNTHAQFAHESNGESSLSELAERKVGTTNFNSWEVNLHLNSHLEGSFCCERCGKVFKKSWDLKRHAVSHSEDRPFSCEQCGKAFKRHKELYGHSLTHSEERPFSCELCGITVKRLKGLYSHMLTHSNERPFSCEQCGKTFKTKLLARRHLVRHSEERPFSCEQCGKAYKERRDLKRHEKTHSEERPFFCEHCGKAFKSLEILSSHVLGHSDEKPFSCEHCGKSFKRRKELSRHILIHSKEKPFSCDKCGKAFSTYGDLKIHMKSHSEERPFSCEQCGKAFKRRKELYSHSLSHSEERPFSCELCGKTVRRLTELYSHILTHSKERPFSCEQCGKTFRTKLLARRHLVRHSEERPFSCEQCGKAYKEHRDLKKHEKTHSEERPFFANIVEKH